MTKVPTEGHLDPFLVNVPILYPLIYYPLISYTPFFGVFSSTSLKWAH